MRANNKSSEAATSVYLSRTIITELDNKLEIITILNLINNIYIYNNIVTAVNSPSLCVCAAIR